MHVDDVIWSFSGTMQTNKQGAWGYSDRAVRLIQVGYKRVSWPDRWISCDGAIVKADSLYCVHNLHHVDDSLPHHLSGQKENAGNKNKHPVLQYI